MKSTIYDRQHSKTFVILLLILMLGFININAQIQPIKGVDIIEAGDAWAQNSINTTIFRRNSLVTFKDTQYIAYYNNAQHVVIGKRNSNATSWELKETPYTGDATDAHKSISIMVDGEGFIHMAWGHHANALNYCKSVAPGSLEFTSKLSMTGYKEKRVTYPEFYQLANGDLLFLYRDGGSGNGNLMLNKYDTKTKTWKMIQDGWLDGEGQRNAYWQMAIGNEGTLYLSWVWRETAKVETNHDMCFAKSADGGITWLKSTGEKYTLPITATNSEYALKIPQNSQLINTTSITSDKAGNPYIATYFATKKDSVPQYRLIYKQNGQWKTQQISNRKEYFTISGGGSKRIPISRPLLVFNEEKKQLYLFFRDEERGSKVSVAINSDIKKGIWKFKDLTTTSVGFWEPTFDTELWKNSKIVNLFVEKVEQGDGETLNKMDAQKAFVLQWNRN